MHKLIREIIAAVTAGGIIPGMVLSGAVLYFRQHEPLPEKTEEIISVSKPEQEVQEIVISVLIEDDEEQEVDLEDYLVSVVLGEMPSDFEIEALKAQAVAARTYTLKTIIKGNKHGKRKICTKSECCQAYFAQEDYLAAGGTESGLERVSQAVSDTSGIVLYYNGELIDATYFACSGGYTEDALAVWGTDLPYLKTVASAGEEEAPNYETGVYISKKTLEKVFETELCGESENWITDIKRTPGRGIQTARVGGKQYSGTQIREKLKLNSTALQIYPAEDGLEIIAFGCGHRVGLSQYGAEAMAVAGSDYREILQHYYQNVSIVTLAGEMHENIMK